MGFLYHTYIHTCEKVWLSTHHIRCFLLSVLCVPCMVDNVRFFFFPFRMHVRRRWCVWASFGLWNKACQGLCVDIYLGEFDCFSVPKVGT